ncbi:hypothetical protein CQ056_24120 [Peribacillus simplex]|uniref:hypothetical protein n=1 Tax=Peribacillus TaxID=2675229 RepID=UPI000D00793A|nr:MULTISPECIES: hypothetical protein [Peribacillus]MCF7625442.1 hypothetical protein [Peribacillus frigoritolerans]PRA78513.1 hypothetical protein CQ056_24120 [Peribacillus simplex]
MTDKELVIKICKGCTLDKLCEYLDSCGDLYALGYIDSEREQEILDEMLKLSALNLWAIHKYVNTNDVNYEYPFEWFLVEVSSSMDESLLKA